MYVVNATFGFDDEYYLVSVLHKACLFVVPDYVCENFESAIYIYLTCGVVCHVHQDGFIMYKMEVVFAFHFET